jgi:serine protein kinase
MLAAKIKVRRIVLSEKDRVGIGTFQPKDEKNQDSTELTGDINYRKIAIYGSDSDPRAFNFDGEFNIANRGIIEFVEMLKQKFLGAETIRNSEINGQGGDK